MNLRIGMHFQKKTISIDSLEGKDYFERCCWCFRGGKYAFLFPGDFELSGMFRPYGSKNGHREFSTSWFRTNIAPPSKSKWNKNTVKYYRELERSWHSTLWSNNGF